MPVTFILNAAPPATAVFGVSEIRLNAEDVMVKGRAFETSALFTAVTEADPACAIRFAGTIACAEVAEDTVVVRCTLFQVIRVLESNPVPVTLMVNWGPPATAVEGESRLMVRPEVMVNGSGVGVG